MDVSALRAEGIDELLEMILLVAEVEDLKANPDCPARGTVIEAQLDRGGGGVSSNRANFFRYPSDRRCFCSGQRMRQSAGPD